MYRVDAPLAVRHRCSGFTLVEMVIALSLATLLLTMALPTLEGRITRQRLQAVAGHAHDAHGAAAWGGGHGDDGILGAREQRSILAQRPRGARWRPAVYGAGGGPDRPRGRGWRPPSRRIDRTAGAERTAALRFDQCDGSAPH